MKVLSGALAPDDGEVFVGGRPFCATSPTDAQAAGIETVWQDLALAPDMGPVPNMFLGREVRRRGPLGFFGFLDNKAMARHRAEEFAELWAKTVVLLDEPTAAIWTTPAGIRA